MFLDIYENSMSVKRSLLPLLFFFSFREDCIHNLKLLAKSVLRCAVNSVTSSEEEHGIYCF